MTISERYSTFGETLVRICKNEAIFEIYFRLIEISGARGARQKNNFLFLKNIGSWLSYDYFDSSVTIKLASTSPLEKKFANC